MLEKNVEEDDKIVKGGEESESYRRVGGEGTKVQKCRNVKI